MPSPPLTYECSRCLRELLSTFSCASHGGPSSVCVDCCTCVICSRCGRNSSTSCGECSCCENCCSCQPFIKATAPHFWDSGIRRKVNRLKRYTSVEIEISSLRKDGKIRHKFIEVAKKWGASIVYDGSVARGIEITTAPANGDLFLDQVKDFLDISKEASAHIEDNAGLHIHTDARDFSYSDIYKMILLNDNVEPYLFSLCHPMRLENRYCFPQGRGTIFYKNIFINSKIYLPPREFRHRLLNILYQGSHHYRAEKYHPSRYHALNLHSWFYRGTIEYRMKEGSLDLDIISGWTAICAGLVDLAYRSSDKEIRQLISYPSKDVVLQALSNQSKVLYDTASKLLR